MKLFKMACLILAITAQSLVFADTISLRATAVNIEKIIQKVSPSCSNSGQGIYKANASVFVKINGVLLTYKRSDAFVLDSRDSEGDSNYVFNCEKSKQAVARNLLKTMSALNEAKHGDVMIDEDAPLGRKACYKTVLDVYFDDETKTISDIISKHIAVHCP